MPEEILTANSPNWQDSRLWEILQTRDSADKQSVITSLNQCMPGIQAILGQASTTITDFTLHDSGHAFRVASRMVGLVPIDVLSRLSTYELALLLLSAYLHDIGMTPEQRRVRNHYDFLLTGTGAGLSKEEVEEFQKWLDDAGYEVVPPLAKDKPTPEQLRLASEILTFYCRFRHNDWSELWIRKNLSHQRLGTYIDWIDDLITLCRSHHQGYDDLRMQRFDPRIVGAP